MLENPFWQQIAIRGWAEKFIGYDAMVEFYQIWLTLRKSFVSLQKPGFHFHDH